MNFQQTWSDSYLEPNKWLSPVGNFYYQNYPKTLAQGVLVCQIALFLFHRG